MGRPDRIPEGETIEINGEINTTFHPGKIYRKRVRLDSGGYDMGGVYWGIGAPLYVEFNKDLTYIKYFRQ